VSSRTGLLAVALVVGGWVLGTAAATAVGAPQGAGGALGLGTGFAVSTAVLRRPARGGGALFALAVGLAVPLWVLIGFLLSVEVQSLVTGAETEHSPLQVVLLYLLLPAVGLTAAALRLRPGRPRRP
jgi:hypothetical protein